MRGRFATFAVSDLGFAMSDCELRKMRNILGLKGAQLRDLSTGEYWSYKLGSWLIGLGSGSLLVFGPRVIGTVAIPMLLVGVALFAFGLDRFRRRTSNKGE